MTTTAMRAGVVTIVDIDEHLRIDSQCYSDPTPSYSKHAADPVPSYRETAEADDINNNSSGDEAVIKQKPMKVYGGARGGLARSVPITVPNTEVNGAIKSMISSLGARKAPTKKSRSSQHRWVPDGLL